MRLLQAVGAVVLFAVLAYGFRRPPWVAAATAGGWFVLVPYLKPVCLALAAGLAWILLWGVYILVVPWVSLMARGSWGKARAGGWMPATGAVKPERFERQF